MSIKTNGSSRSQLGDDRPSQIRLADIGDAAPDAFSVELQCNGCGDKTAYNTGSYVAPTASSEENDRCHDCGTNDWTVLRCTYEGQEVVED